MPHTKLDAYFWLESAGMYYFTSSLCVECFAMSFAYPLPNYVCFFEWRVRVCFGKANESVCVPPELGPGHSACKISIEVPPWT